jgi:DeoR/GlpR family transcriptional regulator of sugar metabolism
MNNTYLTTEELSERIKYDPRTIRQNLKDSVLLEGKHYIRPFGGRKILYIWEVIEQDMLAMATDTLSIPMANGGVCHG